MRGEFYRKLGGLGFRAGDKASVTLLSHGERSDYAAEISLLHPHEVTHEQLRINLHEVLPTVCPPHLGQWPLCAGLWGLSPIPA